MQKVIYSEYICSFLGEKNGNLSNKGRSGDQMAEIFELLNYC